MVNIKGEMLSGHILSNISEEKCKEIGEYLSSTGLHISTDWELVEGQHSRKGYCAFVFDRIENLNLAVYDSKINDMEVSGSFVNVNATFDSLVNTFGATGSTILSFNVDHCEIDSSQIDSTYFNNFKFNDVDITQRLEFKDTFADVIKGEVNEV